jgi:hypothetical protein
MPAYCRFAPAGLLYMPLFRGHGPCKAVKHTLRRRLVTPGDAGRRLNRNSMVAARVVGSVVQRGEILPEPAGPLWLAMLLRL